MFGNYIRTTSSAGWVARPHWQSPVKSFDYAIPELFTRSRAAGFKGRFSAGNLGLTDNATAPTPEGVADFHLDAQFDFPGNFFLGKPMRYREGVLQARVKHGEWVPLYTIMAEDHEGTAGCVESYIAKYVAKASCTCRNKFRDCCKLCVPDL